MGSGIIFNNGGGGGASVNPTSTYMPVNIGGSFVDSIFQCIPNSFAQTMRGASGFGFGTTVSGTSSDTWLGDWNNQIDGIFLQVKNDTISSRIFTANRGFYLDYVINRYIFGDWANIYNGVTLNIDDQNRQVSFTYLNTINGLFLDYLNNSFSFGSITGGTYIFADASNQYINFLVAGNSLALFDFLNTNIEMGDLESRFKLDFNGSSQNCLLGDYNNVGGGTYLEISNKNDYVKFLYAGADNGLYLRYSSSQYYFGDFDGIVSNTYIIMNAQTGAQEIQFSAENLTFFGSAIQSPTAGGSSGEHLVIQLNGNLYKIALLNP